MSALNDADLRHLRTAIALSRRARSKANGTYGALLVDAAGKVLMDAENTRFTDNNVTAHAEPNLVRSATEAFSLDILCRRHVVRERGTLCHVRRSHFLERCWASRLCPRRRP